MKVSTIFPMMKSFVWGLGSGNAATIRPPAPYLAPGLPSHPDEGQGSLGQADTSSLLPGLACAPARAPLTGVRFHAEKYRQR